MSRRSASYFIWQSLGIVEGGKMQQQAFGVLVILAILGGYFYAYFSRSKFLLEKWVNENRYQLLHAEYRSMRKRPFLWSAKGQAVYRVEIRDEQGNNRKGWVRCGNWLLGVFANEVKVKWDD
jgi:hypothetical protein